ncbi:MAG: DoxX family protein [Chitinophagaceae bacterium]
MHKLFSSQPIWQSTGLALVRILTGGFLAYHGGELFDAATMKGYFNWEAFKGFSSPATMVYMGKGMELAMGMLLMLGLFTRIAALGIVITMGYITFFVGHGQVWYSDQHPFLFVLLAVLFFCCGPGALSLDGLLFSKTKSRN